MLTREAYEKSEEFAEKMSKMDRSVSNQEYKKILSLIEDRERGVVGKR